MSRRGVTQLSGWLGTRGLACLLLICAQTTALPNNTNHVTCPCGVPPKKARPGKEIVVVPRYRKYQPYWETTARAIAFPFRAIGTGIYYVVQGPRMLAEIVFFGNRGESFQRMDPCPCPKGFPLWRAHPRCPNPDECWVPPTG